VVAVESVVVVAASVVRILPPAAVVVPLAAVVVPLAAAVMVFVVLAVVLVVAAAVVVVVLLATAFTGAGAGRYLDGVPQNPPKASTTLSLARVKPLARAQAILKTISLFLIASIYLAKVNERSTTLPPLSTDVAVTAAEV
jgi:preprotein translocase subunit SecG